MKYLIAGLGNIGPEYQNTRHNIGFMVMEKLAEQQDIHLELNRLAYTGKYKLKGRWVHLICPTTFMNLSGKSVRYYLNQLKIEKSNLLVVTDDIALPFGTLRMKSKGSDGGHNGLKHIQETLGSSQYPRLRIGIGNDYQKGQQANFVLSPFTEEEFDQIPQVVENCLKGIQSFVTIGIDRTMNDFNRK